MFGPLILHGEKYCLHLFTRSVRTPLKDFQMKASILDCLDYPGFNPTGTHPVFFASFHFAQRD